MAKSHLLDALNKLKQESKSSDLTLETIFLILGEKGHLILILFFSVPFMQPVPLVGLSTPLGILIVLLAYLYWVGKPPYLPKRFSRLKVSQTIILKTIGLIESIWTRLQFFTKRRWSVMSHLKLFRGFNFFVICFSALLLALPLPIPFSNSIPAATIVLNMVGQLEEDGGILALSFVSFLCAIIFFVGLGFGAFVVIGRYYDKIIPFFNF